MPGPPGKAKRPTFHQRKQKPFSAPPKHLKYKANLSVGEGTEEVPLLPRWRPHPAGRPGQGKGA